MTTTSASLPAAFLTSSRCQHNFHVVSIFPVVVSFASAPPCTCAPLPAYSTVRPAYTFYATLPSAQSFRLRYDVTSLQRPLPSRLTCVGVVAESLRGCAALTVDVATGWALAAAAAAPAAPAATATALQRCS
jgi:hypothetical protein